MLTIDPAKVYYIIVKAREFDEKVEPDDPDSGSNPSDDKGVAILEDFADDPTYQELMAVLTTLNVDEMNELLALTWLGRGDFDKDSWGDALTQARQTRDKHAATYLAGTPQLGDLLDEGMAELGYNSEEYEVNRV
ncbi:MAG TPA: DUF3775 domain-containing protein [Candidatus Cybelea sp.]|nr:DUF3775 domain-containing protein [Candidatus Cybelea sp.]